MNQISSSAITSASYLHFNIDDSSLIISEINDFEQTMRSVSCFCLKSTKSICESRTMEAVRSFLQTKVSEALKNTEYQRHLSSIEADPDLVFNFRRAVILAVATQEASSSELHEKIATVIRGVLNIPSVDPLVVSPISNTSRPNSPRIILNLQAFGQDSLFSEEALPTTPLSMRSRKASDPIPIYGACVSSPVNLEEFTPGSYNPSIVARGYLMRHMEEHAIGDVGPTNSLHDEDSSRRSSSSASSLGDQLNASAIMFPDTSDPFCGAEYFGPINDNSTSLSCDDLHRAGKKSLKHFESE